MIPISKHLSITDGSAAPSSGEERRAALGSAARGTGRRPSSSEEESSESVSLRTMLKVVSCTRRFRSHYSMATR